MQNYQQMAAKLNQQQMQQVKEVNDLMNSTMSRCYAAFIAQGMPVNQAIIAAQQATHKFGIAIGVIKEVNNDDRNSDNSSKGSGGIAID